MNVETVTWRELHKLLRLTLMGIGVAFAAAVVSVFLGLSAGSAQAAEDENSGLLGTVTGLVGDTTSVVGSTVSSAISVATDAVTPVVDVAPAPVQQPVAAVVHTAGSAVQAVVAPVAQIVSTDVVGAVVHPVVSVVSEVPIVGGVVSGIGLGTALTEIAADVDESLARVVGALSSTGAALAPAVATVPGADSELTPTGSLAAPASLINGTAGSIAAISSTTSASAASPSFTDDAVTVLATAGLAAVDTHQLQKAIGALCLSVFSSGPGGAGLGVWALAALLPFVAHRAWVRRSGPEDDVVPAAPTGSTDVSPD